VSQFLPAVFAELEAALAAVALDPDTLPAAAGQERARR
jgi:hypothetical protein